MTRDLTLLMRALRFAILLALTMLCGLARAAEAEPALVIEGLECRGNTRTACVFILGHLYLAEGDALDEEEVENAQLRLSSLPNFESVDVYLERGSTKGKVRLVVEVVEADTYARELVSGTSWRAESFSQVFAGRLTHQNLFGTGRLLDFTLLGRIPLDGPTRHNLNAQLQFADPHLFDSPRNFLIASIAYDNQRSQNLDQELGDLEALSVYLSVGRRFGDFSYATLGYGYSPTNHVLTREHTLGKGYVTEHHSYRNRLRASYGWNSEDDAYFPTRGSRFGISGWYALSDEDFSFAVGFRKTWRTSSGSLWTLKVGGTPDTEYRSEFDEGQLLSFTYARPLRPDFLGGAIRRGRWYIEPGWDARGQDPHGAPVNEFGLKAGVRFETKSFGIVHLYLMASAEHRGRGDE